MAAVGPCNERPIVAAASARYQFGAPLPGHAAYSGLGFRTQCGKTNSAHHGIGWMICTTCEMLGDSVAQSDRAPNGPPPPPAQWDRPGDTVMRQAWSRGRLCELCTNQEIVNFHYNHYVKYGAVPPVVVVNSLAIPGLVTTCKCDAEVRHTLCIEDKIDAYLRIQHGTDRIAGPVTTNPWLLSLDFNQATGRARRAQGGQLGIARMRRLMGGKRANACRCGRDVERALPPPLAPPGAYAHAVVQCTACNEIIVHTLHLRVINFLNPPHLHFTRSRVRVMAAAGGPNMVIGTRQGLKYGRHVP